MILRGDVQRPCGIVQLRHLHILPVSIHTDDGQSSQYSDDRDDYEDLS